MFLADCQNYPVRPELVEGLSFSYGSEMAFWAYMLHCRGGAFYTGHTEDLERRISEHQAGIVPGFASERLPVELVWSQDFETRSEALAVERRIKGWSRAKKLALIGGDWGRMSGLGKGKGGPSTGSGRTDLGVAKGIVEQLQTQAALAHPRECCGILIGEGGAITAALPAGNVHPAPEAHFEIDPQALIDAHRAARAGGPRVIGYYHSHPRGAAEPSATDRALAAGDGRVWAIIAGDAVTFWRDEPGGFVPLACT